MDSSEIVVESGGIRVTVTVIEELEIDGTAIVSIPRDEITALQFDHGYVAERPLAGLILGFVLAALSLLVGTSLLRSLIFRDEFFGRRAVYLLTACATALVLGVWLVLHALRQGPFVAVVLRSDKRKLAFRAGTSTDEVTQFFHALSRSHPWRALLAPRNTP